MTLESWKAILFSAFLAIGLMALALPGAALESRTGVKATKSKATHAAKKAGAKKSRPAGRTAGKVAITDGTYHPEATRGAQWVIYDDGSRAAWGANYTPSSGAAGNKFTSTWGSFYVDIMSAYAQWTGTGLSLYFSCWKGVTYASGAPKPPSALSLTGGQSAQLSGLASNGAGWVQVDASTAAKEWIGNTSSVFSNTAWLGVWVGAGSAIGNDVGIDTNGGGSYGFYVDNYSGTGYYEQSWNTMVRARFNGSNVPVELMSLSVE